MSIVSTNLNETQLDRVKSLTDEFNQRMRDNHHMQGQVIRNEMTIELLADLLMRVEALEANLRDMTETVDLLLIGDVKEEESVTEEAGGNQDAVGDENHLRDPEPASRKKAGSRRK